MAQTRRPAEPNVWTMSKVVAALLVIIALAPLSAFAPSLSHYRNVNLGDTVATVVERLQLSSADVKVLYEEPSLVQEVAWRPHRFVSGTVIVADPLAEMALTFSANRLARIVVTYDREKTQGLTDADLLELLTHTYGPPLLQSTTPQPLTATTPRRLIATWADADTRLQLWREEYPRLVGLTITATAADAELENAFVEGARLAALGAPAREREKQAAAAAAIKEREHQVRLENKAKFKP